MNFNIKKIIANSNTTMSSSSLDNQDTMPLNKDGTPMSLDEIERETFTKQVQKQMSVICFYSIGSSFLTALLHDRLGLPLLVSLTVLMAGCLLVGIKLSERFALTQKLSSVKSRKFTNKDLLPIILTEILVGILVYYGLKSVIMCLFWNKINGLNMLSIYLLIFSVYHNGEFFFVLWCHTHDIAWKSFLIYHSREYLIAMSVSYIEFFLELLIFPSFKNSFNTFFLIAFLPLSLAGVFTRIGAFNSARSNFHHLIRYKRDPDHVLVKSGVYAYERHPGYLGYFVFSVSSQLMIKNPISSVIFTLVLWRFFLNRILDEEITLLKFFNGEYLDYKRDVGTHIPMIGKMVDLKLKFMGVKLKKDQ